MKTYAVYASQLVYWRKEVQANSQEEAEAIAFDQSNNEWEEFDYGEWLIDAVDEIAQTNA